MKLVIVESPAKSKTIGHYLGNEYHVEASVGHVRDLAISGKGGLGIDIKSDFKPTYRVNADKVKVVNELKKIAKNADEVLLATDPDREGEAIAWHLAEVLNLPIDKTKRLEFHEITKSSILKAIESPRTINLNLVHSQEARRIVDRILGFDLSNLLQRKIKSKSGGRVQSVLLLLICEHEKEIENFVKEEYWSFDPYINVNEENVKINFVKYKGNKVACNNEIDATNIVDSLKNKDIKVTSISETDKATPSNEPFRTSTLEQSAYTNLGFKTKKTASVAQSLYEGVQLENEIVGLITYMRTDSTRISDDFIANAKDFIINNYGEEFYNGPKKGKDVKLSQDAHEAIRPTNVNLTPKDVKKYLTSDQYKLYKLIYLRTLASLMTNKVSTIKTIKFENELAEFNYKESKIKFKGYDILKIDEEEEKSKSYIFNENEVYKIIEMDKKQNFTEPPARYNEGKLVKLMEERGIGRPSTYSSTIQTLLERKYIVTKDKYVIPTEQGILTNNVLKKYFKDIINVDYTAKLETELDKVQVGEVKEVELLKKFYEDFMTVYKNAKENMYKEPLKETGELCPNCGKPLVYNKGRYGEFISCSNYPECHYIKKEPLEMVGRNCPTCGSPLVYRSTKNGEKFIGCSNYPKCRYAEFEEDEVLKNAPEKICPVCGKPMKLKKYKGKYFYGCTGYPECKHSEKYVDDSKK